MMLKVTKPGFYSLSLSLSLSFSLSLSLSLENGTLEKPQGGQIDHSSHFRVKKFHFVLKYFTLLPAF